MKFRRRFLSATLAVCAAPLASIAQEGKVYRVGCIPGGLLAPRAHQWAAFREALRQLGYVEGKNIVLEFRIPQKEGVSGEDLIAELVRMNVNVLVVSTTFHVRTAKRVTKGIPIVMTGSTDPVAAGIVSNLARPDGNVTGLSLLTADLGAKRLEVLRELLPKSKRIALLWNPNDPANLPQLKSVQAAARRIGMEIVSLEARSADDLAASFEQLRRQHAEGVIIASSGLFYGLRDEIMARLEKAKAPAIWPWGSFGRFGALLVYGPSDTENYRRAASYVDRILKGAKPADLPIEQASTVEFVINLKAAKALGLTVPPAFFVRATQVIQ